MSHLFTSESVSNGHPDKICDQISDSILDEALSQDPTSRLGVETVASGKQIHVLGEMRSKAHMPPERVEEIVRETLTRIGYNTSFYGADFNDQGQILINPSISQQSPDIAQGVEDSLEIRTNEGADKYDQLGAGDQGIMFGYATSELRQFNHHDSSYMPAAIQLSHEIARRHYDLRISELPFLGPDAKTQVTVCYDDFGQPSFVDTVLVSTQHIEEVDNEEIRKAVRDRIILPVLEQYGVPFDENTRFIVNPSGRFVIGGPIGDAGLTGRKIIVDTYGGSAPHGGGAFSGKDPSKVDRSGAYAARWVAKNLVANGYADQVTVQLSYAIGMAHPVSINVVSNLGDNLTKIVRDNFDLRPAAIIERLGLDTFTDYKSVAAYGHMGRTDLVLPWEEVISL